MWSMVRDSVLDRVLSDREVKKVRAEVERQVRDGELTAALGAQRIIDTASDSARAARDGSELTER